MKLIDYFKLKRLFKKIDATESILNHFIETESFKRLSYTIGKSSVNSLLDIYEIRLDRYLNEDTGTIHNGLQEFVENLRKLDNQPIKIHIFNNGDNSTSYTIFTDNSVKNIIGI
ncbi:MAG: hypothetical protein JW682_03510, partial [Campylobacterales bacterium]|nr:hypothetical protein [Campylobacterales bacterium]